MLRLFSVLFVLNCPLNYILQSISMIDVYSFAVEPVGEVSWERDPSGIRSCHDPVQSAQTAGEPGTAEIWWWGHHWRHQVPPGKIGRECSGS